MAESLLTIRNLQKNYGKFTVLKKINLSLEPGKIVGLLGRNGAGKTTLMKCALGLIVDYKGNITFKGEKISHSEVKTKIGSLVDVTFFEDLTAYDNLMLAIRLIPTIPKNKRKQLIRDNLAFVGLTNVTKKKIKHFSFGMKQRLALALSLISEPELLILDEPFVGLDPIGTQEVKELLRKLCTTQQTAILFSSHQIEDVCDLVDHILVLNHGLIVYSEKNTHLANQQVQLIELIK